MTWREVSEFLAIAVGQVIPLRSIPQIPAPLATDWTGAWAGKGGVFVMHPLLEDLLFCLTTGMLEIAFQAEQSQCYKKQQWKPHLG